MGTNTSNYGLYKPAVNSPTDQDSWGASLNTDLDNVDSLFSPAINWIVSSQTSTITVTAPTAGSSSVGNTKYLYLCNTTGGSFVANLPAASTATNMTVAFKKTDSSVNTLTVTGNSTDNIDGSNTLVLAAQYAWVMIVSDGTQWNVISESSSNSIPPIIAQSVLANATGSSASPTGLALAVSQLLGRGSSGNLAAIALGTGLSMSGTTLNSSAASVTISGSMSSNYITFSNSGSPVLMIQVGAVTVATNPGATQTITFPTTFPTACLGVSFSLKGTGANGGDVTYEAVTSVSTSNFVCAVTTARYYIAWGY